MVAPFRPLAGAALLVISCGGTSVDVANDGMCQSTHGELHSLYGNLTNGSCSVSQQAELAGTAEPDPSVARTLCCSG